MNYKVMGTLIAVALAVEGGTPSKVHLPLQTLQSVASPVVSGNNNAVTTWDGWPTQTTVEAGFGYDRYLRPPYSGKNNVPAAIIIR